MVQYGFSPLTHTPLCVPSHSTMTHRVLPDLPGGVPPARQTVDDRWSKEFQGNFWGFLHWNLFETYHWTAWRKGSRSHIWATLSKQMLAAGGYQEWPVPKLLLLLFEMAKAKVLAVWQSKPSKVADYFVNNQVQIPANTRWLFAHLAAKYSHVHSWDSTSTGLPWELWLGCTPPLPSGSCNLRYIVCDTHTSWNWVTLGTRYHCKYYIIIYMYIYIYIIHKEIQRIQLDIAI